MSLKQIALILVVVLSLGSIVGGAWALDNRIDAKISAALLPITGDVRDIKVDARAIRGLMESFLMSLAVTGNNSKTNNQMNDGGP